MRATIRAASDSGRFRNPPEEAVVSLTQPPSKAYLAHYFTLIIRARTNCRATALVATTRDHRRSEAVQGGMWSQSGRMIHEQRPTMEVIVQYAIAGSDLHTLRYLPGARIPPVRLPQSAAPAALQPLRAARR